MRSYMAWIAAASFFLYQYILRLFPSVNWHEWREEFHVNAEEFATLGSYYLLSYSILQIPVGILLDKYGVKKIFRISIILCIFGNFITINSSNFTHMQISRIVLGAGSAAAFAGCIKLTTQIFKSNVRNKILGVLLCMSTAGALFNASFLVHLTTMLGWRKALILMSFIGLLILLFIEIKIPTFDKARDKKNNILNVLKNIATEKSIIAYSVLATGLYAPLIVIGDFWGYAYISTKFGVSKSEAAFLIVMIEIGVALGSILIPFFVKNLDREIFICCVGILIFFEISIFLVDNLNILYFTFVMLGIFVGGEMLCFIGATEKRKNTGIISGFVNTLNMLGGAFLQQAVGFLLEKGNGGVISEKGLDIYSYDDFRESFMVITVMNIICVLIALKNIVKKK